MVSDLLFFCEIATFKGQRVLFCRVWLVIIEVRARWGISEHGSHHAVDQKVRTGSECFLGRRGLNRTRFWKKEGGEMNVMVVGWWWVLYQSNHKMSLTITMYNNKNTTYKVQIHTRSCTSTCTCTLHMYRSDSYTGTEVSQFYRFIVYHK